jgi:hypothetical protein
VSTRPKNDKALFWERRAKKVEARVAELEAAYAKALVWSHDIVDVINFSSRWIHDSTLWEGDEELGPKWQDIWDRAPAPLAAEQPRAEDPERHGT